MCIDYEKFDAHMSSIDVYRTKVKLARRTWFTKQHLNHERYDYPLYHKLTNERIVQFANKLCSGDYLTSFMGTVFQIATYKMMNRELCDIEDYMCGGDDAALLIAPYSKEKILRSKENNILRSINEDAYNNNSEDMVRMIRDYYDARTGDKISVEKSYTGYISYNRRI